MAKQLTIAEIGQAILDGMCRIVEERGLGTSFTGKDLFSMLPDGMKMGKFDLALIQLIKKSAIEERTYEAAPYRLSSNIYASYVENQDSENEESEESDSWQPIKVENPGEVAGEIEKFSTAIKAENELITSHPEEADFVIKTANGAAESLKESKGEITRKWLSTLIDGVRRILKICDKIARIVTRASALIELIKPLL